MIKRFTVNACFLLAAISGGAWASDYGKASKIDSARHGDVVVRYIKEYGSPCLSIQLLNPNKKWMLVSRKIICKYRGRSLMDDVSYAAFEDISFSNVGVQFNLKIIPLELSEDEVYACIVPIKGAVIEEMRCSGLEVK